MFNRKHIIQIGTVVVLFATAFLPASAEGREQLRLYGPSSPAPAIQEAAVIFGNRFDVDVEVISGSIGSWIEDAKAGADFVYATAEFMMSEFAHTPDLGVEASTITPLYLRPSAILVRPGNPKNIEDFPDLLAPGIRVMVVNGSGQVGLWEDMAGKTGNIQTIRDLRRNITHFAATSDEAIEVWKTNPDIDAWLTWNIWHMPLRDQAKLINVSREYRIYRQCNIALTARGKDKPLAQKFIDFLVSREGAAIFESWGWMAPPSDASPLAVHRDICAVCRIKDDEKREGIGAGLAHLRGLIQDYRRIGVPSSEVHICAVLHGPAAYWLLNDAAYAEYTKQAGPNPNKGAVADLVHSGVSIEVCGQTMAENGWTRADLLPDVKIVVGAYPRIVDLELQGYAYLRF